MLAVLPIVIKAAMVALIMAIGMGASIADVTHLLRRPGLLLRSLLAMYVVVPAIAMLLVWLLPLTPGVKATLLVLAVSAGAPLLPRKLKGIGRNAYGFSLVALSSLLAMIVTPAWVAVLARHFGVAAELAWLDVARAIGLAFFVPLVAGMGLGRVLARLLPTRADRIADVLGATAMLVLTLSAVVLLASQWAILFDVRLVGLLALTLFMALALGIGHYCGGPGEDERTTLAVACCTRHIGIAIIVATLFHGPGTLVLLAVYILVSTVVTVPYLRWRRKKRLSSPQAPV
ncbi:hypothetical protein LGR54_13800 [Ancylobacter sp. Lp-2]|uniref:bile acid:sodium symporter family protein n=1 Tax=Ancylobacter sp. Lp-2 TaxID=2881339 RepID=UPI001E536710|nr:hypothetical protein [Ancylobacter sp. Lp-2]MCB4769686.1 hypothetical protein [Ancylobacter sp. Lp-2]